MVDIRSIEYLPTNMSLGIPRVYVLGLLDGCFYVGRTTNMLVTLALHDEGLESAWTKLHPVIGILQVQEIKTPHDERNLTIEMMAKYGIDKVRGGCYYMVDLPQADIDSARKEIWHFQGVCFECGSKDHVAGACRED